jgi:hypothetical protein
MGRRGFLAGVLALPGPWASRSSDPGGEPDDVASTVWSYLDHSSSWEDAVEGLRRYVADGNADAEAFSQIADAITAELSTELDEEPAGVLGLYPAAVLMLDGLRASRVYGGGADYRRQCALVSRLMELV